MDGFLIIGFKFQYKVYLVLVLPFCVHLVLDYQSDDPYNRTLIWTQYNVALEWDQRTSSHAKQRSSQSSE